MIIAIDGPAGSGKSTVAKKVADMLGFRYLDTGAMYRCVAWVALQRSCDLDDEQALADIARDERIEFVHDGSSAIATGVWVAGHDVTDAIRSFAIDKAVSPVAKVADVRSALVEQQRAIAKSADVVMEGRDIGTVVFPNAELKVFLTADARERARRRALQNAQRGSGETDEEAIYQDILRRDEVDSTREIAPLKPAADAVLLDTTGMSIEQVCESICTLARERG